MTVIIFLLLLINLPSEKIVKKENSSNPDTDEKRLSDKISDAKNGIIDLLGHVVILKDSIPRTNINDVWGYVDPVTNREYALVGYGNFSTPPNSGVIIYDVTDPAAPIEVSALNTITGFDVKVWKNYMYSVSGLDGNLGGVVDISDPSNPILVGSIPSSHNITISDKGYVYSSFSGIRIFDLNVDPTNPILRWIGGDEGNDISVIGNRMYDFHGGLFLTEALVTNIYDITDPVSPLLLASIKDPKIVNHHSGWPTEDGNYLIITDDIGRHPTADFTVWDISDLDNISKAGEFADSNATINNAYLIDDMMFASYFSAGFRVFDISDTANPNLLDEFDTSSSFDSEGNANGGYGVYPFLPSGNILFTDNRTGLYIFSVSSVTSVDTKLTASLIGDYELYANYPNPFNPETTIEFSLSKDNYISLVIYNVLGEKVKILLNGRHSAGYHKVKWNAEYLASGVYFYRLQAGDFVMTKKMVLLK